MELDHNGLKLIVDALAFAADKHRDQRRKGTEASPYINHPIALVDVLVNEGRVMDPKVIAAAILHDTVEDTETTEQELIDHFGEEISDIVMQVTDDKDLAKPERKRAQIEHAPGLSHEAKLVKLADKICNVCDLDNAPPEGWDSQRIEEYRNWASEVVAGLRGTDERLERRFKKVVARDRGK